MSWPSAATPRRSSTRSAPQRRAGNPAQTRLDHLVYACDELAGFLVAVALMRPTRKLADVEPANVRKRMKDKAFARAVPREMLLAGAEEIGLDFDEHVTRMVRYLSAVAPEVGLSPSPRGSATGGQGRRPGRGGAWRE